MLANANEQSVATFLEHFTNSAAQFSGKGIGDVADHEAHGFCALAFKSACESVSAIVHFPGDAQDALPSFRVDIAVATDNSRHSHGSYRCFLSDISQGNGLFGLFLHLRR